MNAVISTVIRGTHSIPRSPQSWGPEVSRALVQEPDQLFGCFTTARWRTRHGLSRQDLEVPPRLRRPLGRTGCQPACSAAASVPPALCWALRGKELCSQVVLQGHWERYASPATSAVSLQVPIFLERALLCPCHEKECPGSRKSGSLFKVTGKGLTFFPWPKVSTERGEPGCGSLNIKGGQSPFKPGVP